MPLNYRGKQMFLVEAAQNPAHFYQIRRGVTKSARREHICAQNLNSTSGRRCSAGRRPRAYPGVPYTF
jgi:hypothetical protein